MNPKFVVIIPSYNNKDWYKKNIGSVVGQNYDNFRVIYTDDCSSDNTGELVWDYIVENGLDKTIDLEMNINEERLGAMENVYNMVHSCDDDEIIVVLDGDDWLAHNNVLSKLSEVYEAGDVWMTYGQFKEHPSGAMGCSRPIPQHIKDKGAYRRFRWCSSHLRTFKAGLFKHIKKDHLKINGKFFPMSSDLAAMFPMLEMSGDRHVFIPDILHIYNCETPINDSKVNIKLQQSLEFHIRGMKPYSRLPDDCSF